MVHAFTVSSVARGYHEYKDIWSAPIDGIELPCEREPGNQRDTSAAVVSERNPSVEVTVGHVPRLFSAVCSIFIRRSMASTTLAFAAAIAAGGTFSFNGPLESGRSGFCFTG